MQHLEFRKPRPPTRSQNVIQDSMDGSPPLESAPASPPPKVQFWSAALKELETKVFDRIEDLAVQLENIGNKQQPELRSRDYERRIQYLVGHPSRRQSAPLTRD